MTEPTAPVEVSPFVLEYMSTFSDWERAVRARRRATRVVYTEWIFGGLCAAFGLLVLTGNRDFVVGPIFMLYGLLVLTGLFGRWYRWYFAWRRHSHMPVRETISASGIEEVTATGTQSRTWAHYKAVLELPDALLLMTTPRGIGALNRLPRRGLTEPERWNDLVSLVTTHVPRHPRDPGRRKLSTEIR